MRFLRRLAYLFRSSTRSEELREEVDFHRAMIEREYLERGYSPSEAQLVARRALGNDTIMRESSGDDWGWRWLQDLMQDARHTLRGFARSPGFVAVAVLSLGIGVGANVAVFSAVNALFLRTSPVPDADELLAVYSVTATQQQPHSTSFPNFDDLRKAVGLPLAASAPILIAFSDDAHDPEEIPAEIVSANYFDLLGVRPASGRLLLPSDGDADGQSPIVVISYSLWRRRFAGQNVVGHRVLINTRPFTVVGVAAEGFASLRLTRPVDAWLPTAMHGDVLAGIPAFYFRHRWAAMFEVVARVPTPQARAKLVSNLGSQGRRLAEAFPVDNKGLSFETIPLRQAQLPLERRALWVRAGTLLATVAALVLIIACANVANLLLARAVSRRHEISLRVALGASTGRLRRQLFTEAGLLAVAGLAVGLVFGAAALAAARTLLASLLPQSLSVGVDISTLKFGLLVAVASTLVFGLAPTIHATRQDMNAGLRGERAVFKRLPRFELSRALIMLQSALATAALILSALFVKSLRFAERIDPGFRRENIALATFDLGMLRYDNERGPAFVRQLVDRVNSLPGVVSSAVSSNVVLDGPGIESKIRILDRPVADAIGVHAQAVGLDYFDTMGLRVVSGRSFREDDSKSGAFGWAVVNTTMAEHLWPDRPAVGQRFEIMGISEPYVVVGVVRRAQYESLGEQPQPYFYPFYDQAPGIKKLTLHVRTSVPPSTLLPEIARQVHALNPQLPLTGLRTMEDVLREATAPSRAASILLGVFGVIALLMSVIGIYGVTAFHVGRQRREIGIRRALGATPRNILTRVTRSTFLPAFIGIALGGLLTASGARFVARLLIGVSPTDPMSIGAAAAILVGCAAVAALVPAASALSVDPSRSLRLD